MSKSEFVKLMLDNDMDKTFDEVAHSESVKDLRHRSNRLNNDYLIDEVSNIADKSTRKTRFSSMQKLIAIVIFSSLVIAGIIVLNIH